MWRDRQGLYSEILMLQVERREMVSLWMAYGMLSDMKIGDVGEMISSGVSKSLRWQKWSAVMIKIGGGKTKETWKTTIQVSCSYATF